MKRRMLGSLAERRVKFKRLQEQDPVAARNAARGHVVGSVVMMLFGGLLNRLAGLFYLQYRPDSHYIFRKFPEYGKSFRFWTKGNLSQNGGDIARLYALILNTEDVLQSTSKGDIAELGVFKGNSAGIFAALAGKYKRKVFLFDTFEGFDQRDLTGTDMNNLSPFGNTTVDKVREFIHSDNVFFIKGRFPDSLQEAPAMEEFAVVHIDCDLYAPASAGILRISFRA